MTPRAARPALALALTLALLGPAACGGEGGGAADSAEEIPVRDTTVPPVQRQALTAVDSTGLDPMLVSVELPWTANRVSRDPSPAAPTSTVLAVETLSTDPFDRVVFTFRRDAPFPGYQVRLLQDPSEISCPGEEAAAVDEGPLLAVTLQPASAGAESGLARGLRTLGQPLFHAAGAACTEGDEVTWVAAVDEGTEIRVLELREPLRLVVDLR